MKNEHVSQRLSEREPDEKIEYCRTAVNSVNGNTYFTTPNPALTVITTAVDNYESANLAAKDGGKSKKANLLKEEVVLDNLMNQFGNYVESTANAAALLGGDAQAVILSAGMDFRRTRNKAPLPLAPSGLTGESVLESMVNLSWKSVKYARAYIVEISHDVTGIQSGAAAPAAPTVFIIWDFADVVVKGKASVAGLSSGTKYAFRVYAIGTAGKGATSIPVVVKVL
jgi:hypothetical protein